MGLTMKTLKRWNAPKPGGRRLMIIASVSGVTPMMLSVRVGVAEHCLRSGESTTECGHLRVPPWSRYGQSVTMEGNKLIIVGFMSSG